MEGEQKYQGLVKVKKKIIKKYSTPLFVLSSAKIKLHCPFWKLQPKVVEK